MGRMTRYARDGTSLLASSLPDSQIVPNESGILSGRPSHTIHANHVEMCKFADKDDPGYKKVSEVLKNWAADLKKPIEAKDDQPVSITLFVV